MKMRSRSDKRRILNRRPHGSAQQSARTPEFPATKYESAQAGNTHQHEPRSRVKVQSVTFPSTRLILNSGLRPVSMRTCRRLHLQVGTRRQCVCAPIYIFSFRRSSWGTAYDKNNLTGLNARTACIRAAALSAFSADRRVCAAIHVHVCSRYVLSCAPRASHFCCSMSWQGKESASYVLLLHFIFIPLVPGRCWVVLLPGRCTPVKSTKACNYGNSFGLRWRDARKHLISGREVSRR